MSSAVESARRDWEDGNRRFELASRDATEAERLSRQFDLISAELRRRVGSTFTVAMLADVYDGSDAWALQTIEEYAATPGWARSVSMVGDAAFHVYARGAVDYTPGARPLPVAVLHAAAPGHAVFSSSWSCSRSSSSGSHSARR